MKGRGLLFPIGVLWLVLWVGWSGAGLMFYRTVERRPLPSPPGPPAGPLEDEVATIEVELLPPAHDPPKPRRHDVLKSLRDLGFVPGFVMLALAIYDRIRDWLRRRREQSGPAEDP